MVDLKVLSEKIFSLLKGNGFKIKIFDEDGAETTDPTQGRRFFVLKPNVMVTVNEESSTVEFSKGADVGDEILTVQKGIRRIANEFLMNSDIKVFGKTIEPRDYSYQAKMQKENVMMEDLQSYSVGQQVLTFIGGSWRPAVITKPPHKVTGNYGVRLKAGKQTINTVSSLEQLKPMPVSEGYNTNSLMLSKVYHELDYSAGMTAQALSDSIPGSDLNDVQHALNALLQDDKVEIISYLGKQPVYGKTMAEAITESFSKMFGSLKTSQQTLENVKILVKHKTPVDETVRGARSRHIDSIFLECNGERFRFPHTYLPGARAMAQHLAHGGTMNDKVGGYITESTSNLLKLQSFNRYVTTNKLINEDSSGIVETVKENIETIRLELRKLTGSKTYESVRARLETFERESLAEDDVSQLKDLFTIRRFDEKFEEVLPIVKQLVQEKDTYHKRIEEAAAIPVLVRREVINKAPMFEFSSEHARLGFKVGELALRIVENEELAGFVGKIGTKICKEGELNGFEKAVLKQVLENIQIAENENIVKKEIKESRDLEIFFDKYNTNFF
jgi:predicted acetyltransferase